jgi:hypothetical protein
MINTNSTAITSGLRSRQLKVDKVQQYMARLLELFEQFGSPELKASHGRFAELAKGIVWRIVRSCNRPVDQLRVASTPSMQ